MKKIILSIAILTIYFSVFAQTVVFNEDFESGLSVTSSGTPVWAVSTNLFNSGSKSDSNRVATNDTSYLTTNAFNTVGNSFVILEFAHICKIESQDAAEIQVSNNNGVSWTTLTETEYLGTGLFTASTGNKFTANTYSGWLSGNNGAIPASSWWRNEQFDISSIAANETQVKVRFILRDANGNGNNGNYGWLIDDIKVTAATYEFTPPVINFNAPVLQDTVYSTGPFEISAEITDASGIDTAYIVYNVNGGTNDTIGMSNIAGNTYTEYIPGCSYQNEIQYHICAVDASAFQNSSNSVSKSFYTKKGPDVAVIGTGTSTQYYIPAYGYYNYGWSAVIYKKNEINLSGKIDSIAFYVDNSPSNYTMTTQKVYMKNIPESVFPTADKPDPLTMTLVYDGDITYNGSGWHIIELQNNFIFNGTDNLLIYWENRDGSYTSGYPNFRYTSTDPDYQAKYDYQDASFPTSTGTLTYNRPNIRIAFLSTDYDYDAGIYQITEPNGIILSGTPVDVKVTVKNFGTDILTKAAVNWTVDDTLMTVYNWTGSLEQDVASSPVTIDNKSFTSGSHTIKAWTENPNDSTDMNNYNDTAMGSFYACSSILNGAYTIGGGTADYPTFDDALEALNNCGINGPVVFNVNSETYDTQLIIQEISGVSSVNTITFQSLSGNNNDVIITHSASGSADNYTIKLDGADYICFKNMTIKATGTDYARAIDINEIATNNKFQGNKIVGITTTSTYSDFALVYSTSGTNSLDSLNIFDSNIFENGSYGMYYYGSGSGSLENNTIISNNQFINQYYAAIYLYYQNSPTIISNVITTNTLYTTFYGISASYCDNELKILKNKISIPNGGYGIRIYYSDGITGQEGLIANNFVSVNATSTGYGIYNYYSTFQNIYYNSVNITGTNTSNRALYIYSGSNNINVKNNIFANNGGGYAVYYSVTSGITSDYNDLYTNGTNIGYWSGNVADLPAWQTASAQDSNSVSINPSFFSDTDLHVIIIGLNNKATNIPLITDDIDEELRDITTPDIGADEFIPNTKDAAITNVIAPNSGCELTANEDVIIKIKNFGTDTIFSVSVSYQLNGGTVITEPYNDTILSDSFYDYSFVTKPDLSGIGDYNFAFWVNLTGDENNTNDSIKNYIIGNGYDFDLSAYTMGFEPNEDFTDWTIIDANSDGRTWEIPYSSSSYAHSGENSARFYNGSTNDGDDWLFSRCFILEASKTYKIKFYYRVESSSYPQNIDLKYGTSNDIASMTNTLINLSSFTNTDYQQASATFNVSSDGVYYFAWYAHSPAAIYYAFIDDININVVPPYDAGVSEIISPDLSNCISEGSSYNISVIVNNYGTQNIEDSLSVAYILDSNPPVIEQYYGTIQSDSCDTMNFTTNINNIAGNHNLKVYTMLPSDGFTPNDTLFINYNVYSPLPVPYTNTLDSSSTLSDFCINTGDDGDVDYSTSAANTGAGGMIMHASTSSNWTITYPSLDSLSPDYVWSTNVNPSHNANTRLILNTSGYLNLILKFDLKQLYQYNNAYTNFRILVNGIQITPDMRPNGATTSYNTYEYQLAQFLPANDLTIDFQSKVYYPNTNANYLDNIQVYEPLAQEAGIVSMDSPVPGCGLANEPVTIKIQNFGSDTIIGGLTANYKITGNPTVISEPVNDTILIGNILDYIFTALADLSVTTEDSTYEILAYINLTGDTIHTNDSIYKQVDSYYVPEDPVVFNDTVPYATSATLVAISTDSLYWFDVPSGGSEIGIGSTYITPALYDTTTYYVEARAGVSYNLGPVDNSIGTTSSTTLTNHFTIFDVLNPNGITINSVNIIPSVAAGAAYTIIVKNSSDTEINSYSAITTVGSGQTETVDINFYIPVGTGYKIGFSVNPGMMRNTTGATYPYTIPNEITITGNTFDPNYYYYLYNWNLGCGSGCASNRIPVIAVVTDFPNTDIGVVSVNAPVDGTYLTNSEIVTVKIKNYGINPVTDYSVSYIIDALYPVTELISYTLNNGDTLIYNFITTADLSDYGDYQFKSYTSLTGDNIQENDTAFATVEKTNYCASGATSIYDNDIGNVTISNLNNGVDTPVVSNPASVNTYSDFTDLPPVQMLKGNTYPVSVSQIEQGSYFYSALVNIYIDYDRDGEFNSFDEKVFSAQTLNASQPKVTGNITVPTSALAGLTRMRVVLDESDVAPQCGTYTWGETEDYSVFIAEQIQKDAGVTHILQPVNSAIYPENEIVPVNVIIKNFGTDTLFSMNVTYKLNGLAPVSQLWNGILPPNNTDTIFFTPNITVPSGNNIIYAYTTLANDSNTFNDTIYNTFYGHAKKDAGIVQFLQPNPVYMSGINQNAEVVIKNFGTDTLYNFNTKYNINGGPFYSKFWSGILAPDATDTLLFSQSFVVPEATYKICATTSLNTDGDHANDTLCKSYYGIFTSTLSYSNDFDNESFIAWYNNPTTGTNWELGTPDYGATTGAHSAPNAWDINLSTAYTSNAIAVLYTQVFDFSNAFNAQLSFWLNYNTESGCDGTRLEYSTDSSGISWNTLGSIGDPNGVNWYNSSISSSGQSGWAGNSNGWKKSEYTLSVLDGTPFVVFRFVFTSDGSSQYDGFSIDDFAIINPQIPEDAGIIAINEPADSTQTGSSVNVNVKIRNFGTDTLYSIPVNYTINGANLISETYTDTLAPGDTADYNFTNTYISPSGVYALCSYTNLTNDTYTYNDTLCINVPTKPAPVDAGVTAIIEPNILVPNVETTVIITVKNYGTDTLTSIDVQYDINGMTHATEIWTGTLVPNASANYTFTQTFMSPVSQYSICARTVLSGDADNTNDETCEYISVGIDELNYGKLALEQNIPNPTNGTTTISYIIPNSGKIKFDIVNILGEKVFSVNKISNAGKHQIILNVKDFPKGLYYYSLEFDEKQLVRKMIVD